MQTRRLFVLGCEDRAGVFFQLVVIPLRKPSAKPGWLIIMDWPVVPAILKKSLTSSKITEPLGPVLKVIVLVII